MSCIQNCPTEAIEYGQITQKKKRYRFEKYRYALNDPDEPQPLEAGLKNDKR